MASLISEPALELRHGHLNIDTTMQLGNVQGDELRQVLVFMVAPDDLQAPCRDLFGQSVRGVLPEKPLELSNVQAEQLADTGL